MRAQEAEATSATTPTAPAMPVPGRSSGGAGRDPTPAGSKPEPTTPPTARRDPFEALGDPHRRAIVEELSHGARSVGELAAELPISRPAVSRHLRLLREAGLVRDDARGRRRLYRLDDAGAAEVRAYLERVWGEAAARFRLLAENTTPPGAR